MRKFAYAVRDFLRDEDGLTMVEYAIAGGLIAATGAAIFLAVGGEVNRAMTSIETELGNVP